MQVDFAISEFKCCRGIPFLREKVKKLRKSTLKSIRDTEYIDKSRGNITKKLTELSSNGPLRSLYVLGKFVHTAMELRENSQT